MYIDKYLRARNRGCRYVCMYVCMHAGLHVYMY